nr:MAG TPA: hypothetical protein [Caudoviricetes sp.]
MRNEYQEPKGLRLLRKGEIMQKASKIHERREKTGRH